MSPTLEEHLDTAYQLAQSNQLDACWSLCRDLDQNFPENPQIAFLSAAVLLKQQQTEEAAIYLRAAVNAAPQVPEFRVVLGDTLRSLGQDDAAIEQYREALRLSPGQINVLIDIGALLKAAGRYDEAEQVLREAADADPNHPIAAINMARLLREMGKGEEARKRLEELSQKRDDSSFDVTLASWHLPVVPASLEDMRTGRDRYEQAIEKLAGQTRPVDPALLLHAGTNFMAVYQGDDDRSCQEIIAQFYRRNCPSLIYTAPHIDGRTIRSAGEKIHIGFVSCSFRNHTVGKLFRGIIANLNREIFEVSVFSGAGDDEINHFIRDNCDSYRNLPGDLIPARDIISDARLDILFYADIGMDPLTYFLAFARLAPVQCVGWGHGVTTGLPTMDYFISHHHLEEDDDNAAQSHYSEKLVRLSQPPTYLYPIQKYGPDDAPDLTFADGRTLYCCPQTLFKIHPEFDPLLMEVLKRDDSGVAVFIDGLPGWSDIMMERWRRIDEKAARRIHFIPRLNQNAFLALVDRADVILDSIFTCGGLSSAEALAYGTPIVTWPNSPLLFGRVTNAYYHQIGVLDCIAENAEQYVEIAVRLGRDRNWRNGVAARIAQSSNLLFQRQEILDDLEAFFVKALDQ